MPADWNDDDALAAELAEALRARRDVPHRIMEVGVEAFTWRTVDAELAVLTADSANPDDAELTPVVRREPADPRTMTYRAGDLGIELEATADALLCQIVPPQQLDVHLQQPDGSSQPVAVDEVGWFEIRPRPIGLFRLSIRQGRETRIVTEWTAL